MGSRPIIYSCEGHLLKNYEAEAQSDDWSPVKAKALFGDAFDSPDEWRAFIGRLLTEPAAAHVAAWVARRNDLVLEQMALRQPRIPRGIVMEAAIKRTRRVDRLTDARCSRTFDAPT